MARWPLPLRITLAMLMECDVPMVLAWGPDHIQFHNDACRRLLEPLHRLSVLGSPARDSWGDAWPRLDRAWQQVWQGASVRLEDVTFSTAPTTPGTAGLDLSCSPVRDGSAGVAGVLMTIAAAQAPARGPAPADRDDAPLRALFMQAPVAICITRGPEHRFELVNPDTSNSPASLPNSCSAGRSMTPFPSCRCRSGPSSTA